MSHGDCACKSYLDVLPVLLSGYKDLKPTEPIVQDSLNIIGS